MHHKYQKPANPLRPRIYITKQFLSIQQKMQTPLCAH